MKNTIMDQSAKNERDKKYNLWARKMPTVICLIFPFTIFLVIAFSQEDVKKEEFVWYVTKRPLQRRANARR